MRRISKRGIVLASIPILVGAAAFYGAFNAHRTAEASRNWISVEGEIIEASFLVSQTGTEGTARARSARTFTPQWHYRYEVGGRAYTSTLIGAADGGRSFRTEEEALAAADTRYPVGTTVDVFYDPAEPSSSTLFPGEASPEGMATLLVVGTLMVAVTAIVLFAFPAGPRLPRPRGLHELPMRVSG